MLKRGIALTSMCYAIRLVQSGLRQLQVTEYCLCSSALMNNLRDNVCPPLIPFRICPIVRASNTLIVLPTHSSGLVLAQFSSVWYSADGFKRKG
jgi:hypothetical protein